MTGRTVEIYGGQVEYPDATQDIPALLDLINRGVLTSPTQLARHHITHALIGALKHGDPGAARTWDVYTSEQEYKNWLAHETPSIFENHMALNAALRLYGFGETGALERLAVVADTLATEEGLDADPNTFDKPVHVLQLINTTVEGETTRELIRLQWYEMYRALAEAHVILADEGTADARVLFERAFRAQSLVAVDMLTRGTSEFEIDIITRDYEADIDVYDRAGYLGDDQMEYVVDVTKALAKNYSPRLSVGSRTSTLRALAAMREQYPDDKSLRKVAKRIRRLESPRYRGIEQKVSKYEPFTVEERTLAQRCIADLPAPLFTDDTLAFYVTSQTVDGVTDL